MPRALVFYHYFDPDNVVSAQHYSDLCKGLLARGWDVTVMPSNRACRDATLVFPSREILGGIKVERIWRPNFKQASPFGRIVNAAWMLTAWSFKALVQTPDVLIVGTDPIFSVLVSLPWRLLRPKTKIFHWCFDLHPEAAIADGMVSSNHPIVRLLSPFLKASYRRCDVIGSIGPCMSARLLDYGTSLSIGEYTPWALIEPPEVLEPDPKERREIFGSAKLTLMYSGNFGKAHTYAPILELARRLRDEPEIQFAFSVRGNNVSALRGAIKDDDRNIQFVEFAPQDRLMQRLGAADIQITSLSGEFAGTVVPSKFQGALAVGRPILYAGPADSSVALWIEKYELGWTLSLENVPEVAMVMKKFINDPAALRSKWDNCFKIYHQQFSKNHVLDNLDSMLKKGPEGIGNNANQ